MWIWKQDMHPKEMSQIVTGNRAYIEIVTKCVAFHLIQIIILHGGPRHL